MKKYTYTLPQPSIKYLVFFTGVLFMVLGVVRQEHITVLKKAITICLECIGIG